jgi:transcriptional regulator with XRE-family HTH domain
MTESLGRMLREAREAKGYVLEDVERATRIRAKYLEALEEGDFEALPSEAQLRGFLRNYAQFLSLDGEQVLAHYKEALGQPAGASAPLSANQKPAPAAPASPTDQSAAPPPRPSAGQPVNPTPQIHWRRLRLLSPDFLVGGTVTLLLVLLLLWGVVQITTHLLQTSSRPTLSPIPALHGATPATAAASPTVVEATATVELPTPLAVYTGVNLIVRAEQRVWLRVTVDGGEAFAGLLAPGASKEFTGQNVIELITGNGQGTRVIWNGRDQGTLGELGEVVDRLWTLDGMIVPTPTVGPTIPPPTETPNA